jgi:hypothetical protein
MALPPISSPAVLWNDLRAFLRSRQRHEVIFAGFAVLIPTLLVIAFLAESRSVDYKAPTVIFVKDWNKGRTDAEIKRQQAIDAPGERAARKEEAEFEAKKRQQFKDLQKALGI